MSLVGLDFSDALRAIRQGDRVTRAGWNGKGMWITLSPGKVVKVSEMWSPANRDLARRRGGEAVVRAYLTMKTVDDEIVPWLPSQSDVLAQDWRIYNDPPEKEDV